MTDFDSFLDDCDAEFDGAPVKADNPKFARKTFKCDACGGSGLWRGGRANSHGNAKCNVCHGRGELVTSPEARAKARAGARASKAKKIAAAQELNAAHGDGFLLQWLQGVASWNSFAASLVEQHDEGRAWSEKQVAACRSMYRKMKEKAEARQEEQRDAPKADSTRIVQMFADALANGKKRRALLAGQFDAEGVLLATVKMTPARDGERIWVKVDREYCGGIAADGRLMLTRAAPEWLPERLQTLAADPDGECRLYGQRTGTCSCCGRELTNKESIDLGIGPICREKWGLG